MASAARPTAVKLNFPEYAKKIRRIADLSDAPEDELPHWFIELIPPWVCSHHHGSLAVAIHLEGAVGHPDWNEDVHSAVKKYLLDLRNRSGVQVTLTTD